jgi:hypothetical protein
MNTNIKLTFHDKEIIKNLEQDGAQRMLQAVNEVRNITLETLSGTRTGREYKVPGTQVTYTASAPGEPPAVATGELRQSVSTAVEGQGRDVIGYVGSDSKHAAPMEYGTKNIAPRPWLRPSFEKALDKVKEILSRKYLEGMK